MKKHGGYFGENREDIIDFSVNINPLGVPSSLKSHLTHSIDSLENYPEIDGESVREKLSDLLLVDKNNILIGNGATELIYLFAKSLKFKRVLVVSPTFTEYERAFKLSEGRIYRFLTHEKNEFKIDTENLKREILRLKPDLLVFCNPNNPTGVFSSLDYMKSVLEKAREISCTVFVDESFIDFREGESFIELIEKQDLFLLRSLTKLYSVPGLRIGYGIGSVNIIEKLNLFKEPWTVNSLALSAVPVLLDDREYLKETRLWYLREKEFLKTELEKMEFLKIFDSDANFFLCKALVSDSKSIRDYLLGKKIYIRTCEDFYGLDETFFRIALRTRRDNELLIDALKSYYKEMTRR